jgi:hypothetical protein
MKLIDTTCFWLLRLVCCIYFNLDYTISIFSLPLDHQRSISSLQYSVHSHISIISLSQYHHSTLNHLEFIFWTTKLRKQLYKNLKYDT